MNPDVFFKNFELLADAPNGVQKLRELILQLAVMGKLVPQDLNDEPASVLLERTQTEIKRAKPLKPITEEEIPFEIPVSWEWVRIGDSMDLVNGRAFKPSEWSTSGLPIIRIQNLNNPNAPFNYCDFEIDKKVHVYNSDFLISWSGTPGTSFGAFVWNRGNAVLNQHIFKANLFGNLYIKEFLKNGVTVD